MLLNRKALKVIGASSTDTSRYAINGIRVLPDGSTIGVDGRILMKFTPAFQAEAKEFPPIDGMTIAGDDETPEPALEAFTLPNDAVNQIIKALPKKKYVLPILDNIALDVAATNLNGHAVMAVTDLETPQVFKPKKVDAQFPDWQKIIPDGKNLAVKIGFTVNVLEKLLKTLKALDVEQVAFSITDNLAAVLLSAKNRDGDEITGAIMPCRID